jgi:hypothetical protein
LIGKRKSRSAGASGKTAFGAKKKMLKQTPESLKLASALADDLTAEQRSELRALKADAHKIARLNSSAEARKLLIERGIMSARGKLKKPYVTA